MDNASGIATLLETAAAAAAAGGYKRSVVFAAVTAEEKGLLGSRYFANRASDVRRQARRQSQHRHVPAALSAEERGRAGARRIRSGRRPEARRAPARHRGAVGSRARTKRVRAQRSIQLHQDRRAGAVAEGRLHEGFAGAPAGQAVADRAVSRAERRSRLSRSIASPPRISARSISRSSPRWPIGRRGRSGTATASSSGSPSDPQITQMRR